GEGRILVDGKPADLSSPAASAAAGIGVVHQHFMLVPTLSALDNVALAMPELGLGRFDRASLSSRMGGVAERLGFRVEPAARVDTLDVAAQQRIEIVKALMHEVRLLILDEPTAVLGPEDKENLFATIRRLRAEGVAVVLITHKLEDIFAVADRAAILRGGALVADMPVAALTPAAIVSHMVGTADAEGAAAIAGGGAAAARAPSTNTGDIVCRLRNVALRRPNGSLAVSGLEFDLAGGEIVAVAGVDGNGQSELMRMLAGMETPAEGSVECLGVSTASGWSAARLHAAGVAHIPEDRRRSGIVAGMTLARNYLLRHAAGRRFWRGGLLRRRTLDTSVAARIAEYEVRCTGPADRIERLSGGNQQKLVLARELDGAPKLILAAHPSRGLDIKTIRFVHRLLEESRAAGRTVLLLSSDLDEIMQLADRVVVLAAGRAFGPVRAGDVTRAKLGAWIAGHAAAEVAA
ncbi:MAG: ABC transporter ATP-binding protein, partial [Rhizobiaceae bacterium]